MNISIASGKGGTGKTTVSTNLALYLAEQNLPVRYLDCDVEEPNGHLFLKPIINHIVKASIPVPIIDDTKCVACGKCVRFCNYNALVKLGDMVMVFPELCHGCGGCTLLCSHKVISESNKEIGVVETGESEKVAFAHGRLIIGEAMSPPLIRAVLKEARDDKINIIDAPPGTSCPVITSIRTSDFVVLVTEPSPFGLNDLGLAIDMVRELALPHGVIVNRADPDNTDAAQFCKDRNVEIIAEIPESRSIAECYSNGGMILNNVPGIRECFAGIWGTLQKRIAP